MISAGASILKSPELLAIVPTLEPSLRKSIIVPSSVSLLRIRLRFPSLTNDAKPSVCITVPAAVLF